MVLHVKKSSRIIAFLLLVVLLFAGMAATYKSVIEIFNQDFDLQGGLRCFIKSIPLNKGDKIDEKSLTINSANIRKSC